ncbi:mast cell protease 1A-like [Polymixia lowei]
MIHFYILFLLQVSSLTGASESGIIGGKVSKPYSRGYMVSLQVRKHHVCGGMLIRKDFVLTSAHCKQNEALTVVLGAHNITKKEKSQQKILVDKYYQHPNYTDGKYSDDVMLLKLKTNARLDRYVKTIGLPKKDGKIPANINCIVAGWGRTGPKMAASDVLRETTVKIQFSNECKSKWINYFNSQQMICTHSGKKKAGICQGDSGGPLICNTKVQGITAFTKLDGCDDPKYPHVFMKIPFFVPWIKTVMQG